MERTILSHDLSTARARVRFEHNGVIVEDDYDLKMIVPGSAYTLAAMGIEFDEPYQLKALDYLTKNIETNIDNGDLTNPPAVVDAPYVAPPEVAEEPAKKTPKK